MARKDDPVFGENGVVLNPDTYQGWISLLASERAPVQDILRRRDPQLVFMLLGILAVGPLNPSMLIWIPLGFLTGAFGMTVVFWLVALPSTVAVLFGIGSIYRDNHSFESVLGLAFKRMAWVGVILASPSLLFLFSVPVVPIFSAVTALVVGGVAALAGATVLRLVVYEWRPITPLVAKP